jgi:hypothetical protein
MDQTTGETANMILILPLHFDANEGLATVIMVILLFLLCVLPKRIPLPVTLLIMIFNSYLGRAMDNILAIDYPFNLYDTMDTPTYDLYDFLLYTIVFPLYGYFYVYFYHKYPLRGVYQVIHIVIWSAASVLFEALGHLLSIFQYNNWHLSYSLPIYLLTFGLNSLLFHLGMRLNANWKLN